jgi:hypothetical protein
MTVAFSMSLSFASITETLSLTVRLSAAVAFDARNEKAARTASGLIARLSRRHRRDFAIVRL